MKSQDGDVPPGRVRELAVCDLEVIAATLQCAYYGDWVESSLMCGRCGHGFDLSFDLAASLGSAGKRHETEIGGPDERGVFTLGDGRQFRLPTGADELAVADLDAAEAAGELRSRCVIHGDFESDPEVLDAAMEATGPLAFAGVARDLSALWRGEDDAVSSAAVFSRSAGLGAALSELRSPLSRQELRLEPYRNSRHDARRPKVAREAGPPVSGAAIC